MTPASVGYMFGGIVTLIIIFGLGFPWPYALLGILVGVYIINKRGD